MAESSSSFRSALRHRDYRWLVSAFVISNIGSWAYNVALVVWVFEETGSPAWAGVVSLARFVPALLFSAYGGVLAERFERRNLVVVLNVVAALMHALLALTVAVDGAIVVALALAAAGTLLGTIYEPAIIALTPQIVGEKDLAAANSLNGMIDNGAIIAGPAIGAVLLVWFSPPVVLLMNAATFVYAAAAAARVRTRSTPSDVTEGGGKGPIAQMVVGFRALAQSRLARDLAGFSIAASFFYGTDTVLFVVLSEESLGTEATGYGYLLTALGVGGVLAAPLINRLAARPNLGTVIAVGMAAYTLPTAVMVIVEQPAVAFGLQVVRGAGTLVVDVLAITAMQRTLPGDLVARVYGVFIALVLAAISLGAIAAPALLELLGLTGSLLFLGLVPTATLLLGARRLRAINQVATERLADIEHRISVLQASPLFAALTRPSIEQLAAAAGESEVGPATVVVSQGDEADAVYLIIDGTVAVSAHGAVTGEVEVAELGPGEYFGEIGLLESAPRNATCTASTPCHLLRIDGEAFLAAVHQAPQTGFLNRARHREARTHHLLEAGAPGRRK
ncbi:MAG: MFS transporter [Myxococcota bacterium]